MGCVPHIIKGDGCLPTTETLGHLGPAAPPAIPSGSGARLQRVLRLVQVGVHRRHVDKHERLGGAADGVGHEHGELRGGRAGWGVWWQGRVRRCRSTTHTH